MVGPHVRNRAAWMSLAQTKRMRDQFWKSYFATEIPACSVMGENMYVSGVTTGVVMTLPTDPEKVSFIFNTRTVGIRISKDSLLLEIGIIFLLKT